MSKAWDNIKKEWPQHSQVFEAWASRQGISLDDSGEWQQLWSAFMEGVNSEEEYNFIRGLEEDFDDDE